MGANSILRGVSKYVKALNNLSKESGLSKFYLYSDCIWSYLRYGCVLNQYTEGRFYLRREFERKHILTYRKWKKVIRYNDPKFIHILKDKITFNQFFSKYVGREWLDLTTASFDDFYGFIERHKKVFVKPIDGLEGDGCHIMEYEDGVDYHDIFERMKKKRTLIEELVIQHPDMVFGNNSVNTIRVYSIFDNKVKKGVCFKTTLRAGVGSSIVDNSHFGGVSYEIDLQSGRIISKGWGHQHQQGVITHPETNICMLGREIPYWKEAIQMCEDAAQMIPQVRYIGWDVAITQNGPILIEGNNTPDLDIMEFVGNYGYYDIIKSHLK